MSTRNAVPHARGGGPSASGTAGISCRVSLRASGWTSALASVQSPPTASTDFARPAGFLGCTVAVGHRTSRSGPNTHRIEAHVLTPMNRRSRAVGATRLCLLIGTVVAMSVCSAGTAESRSRIAYAAGTRHCRDVGPPQTDVGLYHITASGIACRRARSVLNRWYYDRSAPHSGPRGWRCSTRQIGPYSYRTTCTRKKARIGFTQYSA